MMVVLEGPDGGGKSSLAELLHKTMNLGELVSSEGPEKYPGEINARIERYLYGKGDECLYDRHPCVSQIAYMLVHDQTPPDPRLIEEFYRRNPLLIYCRPRDDRPVHTASGEWDTPEYLASVDQNYMALMNYYDEWAVRHAHYIYRIGDPIIPIRHLIKTWRRL